MKNEQTEPKYTNLKIVEKNQGIEINIEKIQMLNLIEGAEKEDLTWILVERLEGSKEESLCLSWCFWKGASDNGCFWMGASDRGLLKMVLPSDTHLLITAIELDFAW